MLKVIDGDIDKLGVLYERYKTPLYAYFFKVTGGDGASSEDLVQGVFYKALKYKHSFKGSGEFKKWLFSIAHNVAIDHFRHSTKYRSTEIDDKKLINLITDSRIDRDEKIEQLYKAMSKLNEYDRELLIMSKIECMKYRDISEIHNSTESAIKTRIFRSLRKLREIYFQLEEVNYEKE